jgi:hypothetical protein
LCFLKPFVFDLDQSNSQNENCPALKSLLDKLRDSCFGKKSINVGEDKVMRRNLYGAIAGIIPAFLLSVAMLISALHCHS